MDRSQVERLLAIKDAAAAMQAAILEAMFSESCPGMLPELVNGMRQVKEIDDKVNTLLVAMLVEKNISIQASI